MITLVYNTPNSPLKQLTKTFTTREECDAYIAAKGGLVWVVEIKSEGKAVASSLNKLFGC